MKIMKCVDLNWDERVATIVGFVCLYIKIKIARQNMPEKILDYRKCCKDSRTSYCNKPCLKTKEDCHIIVHTIVTFEARKYKKVIVSVKRHILVTSAYRRSARKEYYRKNKTIFFMFGKDDSMLFWNQRNSYIDHGKLFNSF